MQKTTKSNRLHIGIFGKRNVGKSTLINKLTKQDVSIVSDVAGTTTDPVEKSMEFLPLGPVLFIDTAGIDDVELLGEYRVDRTKRVFDRVDIAIIVSDYLGWDNYELDLYKIFTEKNVPVISVINKQDVCKISEVALNNIKQFVNTPLLTSLNTDDDIVMSLKEQMIKICPDEFINPPSILKNLVQPEDTVVLVIPIDKEAPKGRLILPQVQVIRDILDNQCQAYITQVSNLKNVLDNLKTQPKLVITDSQVFKDVDDIVPDSIALTSFSILFANLKGDLSTFYEGASAIDNLNDGDKVLICESCTHHQIEDDIARVKIPNLLKSKTQKNIEFVYKSGHDFDEVLSDYSLVIHCGACMTNKKEVLSRIMKCKKYNIPITNYGIAIAHCVGILNRSIAPFKILDNRV